MEAIVPNSTLGTSQLGAWEWLSPDHPFLTWLRGQGHEPGWDSLAPAWDATTPYWPLDLNWGGWGLLHGWEAPPPRWETSPPGQGFPPIGHPKALAGLPDPPASLRESFEFTGQPLNMPPDWENMHHIALFGPLNDISW